MTSPPKKTTAPKTTGGAPALPSRQQILDFINAATSKVGKREIARAFNIKGDDKIPFKSLLRDMKDEGLISNPRKKIRQPGHMPKTTVLEVVEQDKNGELLAVPSRWDEDTEGPAPRLLVLIARDKKGVSGVPGVGDRVLARIKRLEGDGPKGVIWQARPIKNLGKKVDAQRYIGIFQPNDLGGGQLAPVDRKAMKNWEVRKAEAGGAEAGELVEFEPMESRGGRRPGARGRTSSGDIRNFARITRRLGNPSDDRQISLIAIHRHDIPVEFPQTVLAELETLLPPDRGLRLDLRHMPLITIDPPDARDHDDAIFAMADENPKNPGGHLVTVAIADVAHYVQPHSELDREALRRGNSAYFPDRVVPMLPDQLSGDLCSLKDGEERACLAVQMQFDKNGKKRTHQFVRAIMKSAGSLTYEQAQAAIDGHTDDTTGPLLDNVLKPLWAAYRTVMKGRASRNPLALELPERKIKLGADGHVAAITTPERLDAHKLVEEFMIQSNVAAAETLEAKKSPLIYRVHQAPSAEKVSALSDFLKTLDMALPKTGVLLPEHFNRILGLSVGKDYEELVNETILRSQSQAEYTPENAGHFGLNLRRYAHFTSPIRRYADLIVHRALIAALGFGKDGLRDDSHDHLPQIAKAISDTERRAMAAERETVDRLIAHFLAAHIGASFDARISGVTRSGLFVRLSETGADGFIPARTIGREYFYYDEQNQALTGEMSGESYRLGDKIEVRLVEAIPSAGALRFEILSQGRMETPRTRHKRAFKGKKFKGGKNKRARR